MFRYEPSTNPKNTVAEAIAIKPHKVSKALPNGRIMSSPSANLATHTAPLRITAQSIGTSDTLRALASRASRPRFLNEADEVTLSHRAGASQDCRTPSLDVLSAHRAPRRVNCFLVVCALDDRC